MLRKGRNSRGQHLVWSETQQDADVMTDVKMSDREEWDQQLVTEISDLESEVDYLAGSQTASDVVALPSTPPLLGENFYSYKPQEELNLAFGLSSEDLCEDEDHILDWVWDEQYKSSGAFLSGDSRKVSFHSDYSCGTAAIRGHKELSEGQHYWEVKMTSPVYGTDMMVGIGTSEVNLDKFKYSFGSLLGHDEDSWGLSYTGLLQHKGDKVKFSPRFGQGSIIGVHLDTWHGTLSFYHNRQFIGVAATNLQNKKFYPMVCSTAAKSSMKVVRACYTPTSLQYLCCARLRRMLPCCPDVVGALELPPGLRTLLQTQLFWIFSVTSSTSERETHSQEDAQEEEEGSLPPSPVPSSTSSPASTMSACSSPGPYSETLSETDVYLCPCHMAPQTERGACRCPPTPPSSDYDSCCSEPEDYQCKRCRWT
ncbi:SPRY domain-containing SOCS box protein 3 [Oryzias melastigma]|uniref:SPRY domain-containing SOCS box protein 3 n=1 Tax=Oryzias melastigma TaxID=30732 RepID=A0A3B3CCX4_ORYME|nr:SPRY domain-containing SOCS box protein 3 [Oryzias melastigma]XP_024140324.1 SPRY domain-containing SOCS box protein 3 [Oryzias melastigma]KAF6734715.1 SPRY domain-containing SOCS box protein 3 [Oryzias melastigma]